MALTKSERLILANQYRILTFVDPKNAKSYERAQEALESGYESAINTLFDPIFDGLSESECSFVIRVMAMYDALQRSQSTLGANAGVTKEEVQFPGFDGNHETEYMAYARYVIQHEDRFTYLEPVGSDFNSHMPSLALYRAMLREWQAAGEKYDLSEGEIRHLLSSR